MHNKEQQTDSTRRALIKGAGSVGAGALAGMALGGNAFAAGAMHNKGMQAHHQRKHAKMTDAINHCVLAGNDCIAHCLDLIKNGDNTIIDCLRSTEQMRAFCQAHAYLSAADSPHLNDICRLAIKICGDCSKACDKHAEKHAICKACRDACDACVKACKTHLKRVAA
ncbi:MAG: four-helix bundle copper-binding protein [Mariprofundales bacterium]